jgi:MFS transporter, SP family, solute carrier family 2 (myo-inositol transporter), member 13
VINEQRKIGFSRIMENFRRSPVIAREPRVVFYGRFLIFVAGLGGLLYGIDLGIIAAALLYLSKTVNLSIGQTSVIVAAVLGGSMLSSPVAGVLADWLGRKKIMIASGLIFVISVGLIVISQGFIPLFLGRLLQGMSGGVIAVVVPLYLAESLSANNRGRGTAIFQFMLTFGIVIAAFIGWFYTRQAEAAIALAAGNPALIRAAQNHAWRGMFQAVIFPGLLFFAGGFALSESPRWLLRQGRPAESLSALRRSASEEEAALTLREMQALEDEKQSSAKAGRSGSLLQRKYVLPFFLACTMVALNQATGINSVLSFLVVILKQTGMDAVRATQGDVVVKVLCCGITLVAVALVEKKGRKFLLEIGTGGIVLSLIACALLFLGFESKRTDVKTAVESARTGNRVALAANQATLGPPLNGRAMALTVLYSYGNGNRIATVLSDSLNPVLKIEPDPQDVNRPLVIRRAFYGPVPLKTTGWLIAICLALFVAFFAVGPGVVGWLVLSELMPMRIRSIGMGIGLLLNQGVSTLIAAVFLPVVGNHGYYWMFFLWAGFTAIYFIAATFFLPETKGKTLEEIEMLFE